MKLKALLIASLLIALIIPAQSSDESKPIFYVVAGFIKYDNGSLVCNATVFVKNMDKGIVKTTTSFCDDDKGFYAVVFNYDAWQNICEYDYGDVLRVEALKGAYYGKVTTQFTYEESAYKIVNVTIFKNAVYALATGPKGVSNNRNITITYVYNGFPDYVSIYYSNDGNKTWHLAGNDGSLDGKFNFSLPCDGKYGFIAVAIGGGSNESLPEENEIAECYPYVYDSYPPYIEITEPENNSFVNGTVEIKWAAYDSVGIKNIEMQYSTDGVDYGYSTPLQNTGEYTWDISCFPDGTKLWLKLTATDNASNTAYDIVVFTLDKSPPITTLQYGKPYYNDGDEWITSLTPVYLNASDDGAGVNATWYRIWYNGWTPWMLYTMPFFISNDGLHYIEYYSVDNVGNAESPHNATIYVDNTPPIISNITASPSMQVVGGKVNITCIIIDDIATDAYLEVAYPNGSYSNFTMHNNSSMYYVENNYGITGTYNFTIYAKDMLGNANKTGIHHFTISSENHPPEEPNKPNGSTKGVTGVAYAYSTSTTDPDGDFVYYLFDWGDGSTSGWLGPYVSGNVVSASHIWGSVGIYNVRVKAKDSYGHESQWSDNLTVTILSNSPPVTICSISPAIPDGKNGWYLHAVNISFNATDPDGDAIAYTKYRIDGGAWHEYTVPFEISQDGNHTLEFYSADDKGNAESVKNAIIKIDKSKPVIRVNVDIVSGNVCFNVSIDDINNVTVFIEYWYDGNRTNESMIKYGKYWKKEIPLLNGIHYIIHAVDIAGNWNETEEGMIEAANVAIKNITFPSKQHVGFVNITCNVSNATMVWINVTMPNGSYANETMRYCNGTFYLNSSFSMEGNYSFYIYATNANGNGVGSDMMQFRLYPKEDVDMSGSINVLDLIVVAMHFGSEEGSESYMREADVNKDGVIDILDMILVAMHWTG